MANALRKIETFVFNPQVLSEIKKSPEMTALIKKGNTMIVQSHEDSAVMLAVGMKLSKFIKFFEKEELKITRPIKGKAKEVKGWFGEFLAPFIEAEKKAKSTNFDFVLADKERVAKATKEAEVEETRRANISLGHGGEGNFKPVARPVPTRIVNPTKTRKSLKTRIIDEAKVPREYMIVDTMKIDSVAMAELKELRKDRKADETVGLEELTPIAGIEYYWDERPVY